MKSISTKETAEAVLRELPSVLGACVREDVNGHPREVHLLVGPGPNVRNLARDVRDLLEEKLHVPVDQRVISIAQLSSRALVPSEAADRETAVVSTALTVQRSAPNYRVFFQGLETSVQGSRVLVRVRVRWAGEEHLGEATEVDAGHGRVRAAASAALRAATAACNSMVRLELDAATVVTALDREYVIVAVLAASAFIGRKPLTLSGAQPVEADDAPTAAAFAALKAVNRVLELGLKAGEPPPG
jgi:hypothetical protein